MRGFGGVVSSSSAIIIKPQTKCYNTMFCSEVYKGVIVDHNDDRLIDQPSVITEETRPP